MKYQSPTVLDHSNMATLYQLHAPKIFDYVQRQVSSFQDAEDILIEVFVAALENTQLANLTGPEQQAWLWRVARNKTIDFYRRRQRVQHFPLADMDEHLFEANAPDPEQISIQQEQGNYLAQLIKRLSPLQQQVLSMRFGENLRCAQIAVRVGKSEGSVRSILSRVMNLLRSHYKKQEGEVH